MKKNSSKWLCLLLAVVMLASMIPSAIADKAGPDQLERFINKVPGKLGQSLAPPSSFSVRSITLGMGDEQAPQTEWQAPQGASEEAVAAAMASEGYYMEADPVGGYNVYTLTDNGELQMTHYASENDIPTAFSFVRLPDELASQARTRKRDVAYVMNALKSPLTFVQTEYPFIFQGEHIYTSQYPVSITAQEMLNILNNYTPGSDAYEFYLELGISLGLGTDFNSVVTRLNYMIYEYQLNLREGLPVEEPTISLENLDLTLFRRPFTFLPGGTLVTNITVSADATYTIQYGSLTRMIEPDGDPTNFVITLDISGSMNGDRYQAMMSALKTTLDTILANPQNTVSLTFFGTDGNVLILNGTTVFSGAAWTSDDIFDAPIGPTGLTLRTASCTALENALSTGSMTYPETGLQFAYNELANLYTGHMDAGVLLFTDGFANGPNSEALTVEIENQIARMFGATVVNVAMVSAGQSETQFWRYLNPDYAGYQATYPSADPGAGKILYHHLLHSTSTDLEFEIQKLFDEAIGDITDTTLIPHVETITENVLAAVNANLLDHLPAGYNVYRVEVNGVPLAPSYWVQGVDEYGDPVISFDLGSLYSGDNFNITYFSLPASGRNVTAFNYGHHEGRETVLYAETADNFLGADNHIGTSDSRRVKLLLAEKESHAKLDKDHILVVNFSNTGNTARLAKLAAEELGADYFEIIPAVPYTAEDLVRNNKTARAYAEFVDEKSRPEMANQLWDTSRYSVILIAYPIWFGQEPRIMDTFVESLALEGQLIVPFCTSESSSITKSRSNLKALTHGASTWLSGKRFAPDVTKDVFLRWVKSLNLKNYK